MKLSVTAQNNFPFYPDLANNLSLPEKDRFTIVVQKVNKWLQADRWTTYEDGNLKKPVINMEAYYREHIREIKNSPMLSLDNGTERLLEIKDLFSGEFMELNDLLEQVIIFITKISKTGEIETKKS